MKKLLLCAVFSTAGLMFANAQTVKADAKTDVNPATAGKALEKTTEKTESTVSQILKGTQESAEKAAAPASQTAQSVLTPNGQGVNNAAAQNAAKTDVNLKAHANDNVIAHENANPNAAITTQTEVKGEAQPQTQPAEKTAPKKEAKVKSKAKVD
ncbi:hypothetical protein MHJ94_00845 [Chryseobacterium taklimakanense]|uniref:hypothetical protein n=1 Tax=Chryseobacterium taklimakanense TaxID=536441 RepID=UPI001EF3F3D8|nr:hypothetical protein [Chryseobacterium taklimakanense]MCG7279839.1 hypothetical protein [Chryseobacterium taklimakanense]